MPLKHIKRGAFVNKAAFVDRLRDEWQNPTDDETAPIIIIEEPVIQPAVVHLYVIWDLWKDIDWEIRSEIIMDAYRGVTDDEKEVLRVKLAMGLTKAEAQRMGIEYE